MRAVQPARPRTGLPQANAVRPGAFPTIGAPARVRLPAGAATGPVLSFWGGSPARVQVLIGSADGAPRIVTAIVEA